MAVSYELKLLVLGVFIHVLYLSSVFYIYFKSPILSGLNEVDLKISPPAKRLVLFVADGLQAEKAYHRNNKKQMGYLRHIITSSGRWGVSHTRVPTESRVGHVSLMAGTYEDISAITNGWKVNPVEFDSLFNQSFKTWCWGSPDILNIFDKYTEDNIESFSYNSKEIDFASSDPSWLDRWVFEHVYDFLSNIPKSNKKLSKELHEEKVVFFLHLLGIDTNGHSKKPDSKEYLDNIAVVNEGIRNITKRFQEVYDDDKTVFIVTSDHGMTPWGAHGTGLQSETETPFIAWGAGIRKPTVKSNINKDPQCMRWGLEDYLRTDLKQIDIAPLMSFLLGLRFPANSVGILPHVILDVGEQEKALGMLHNVQQIKEQYDAHENQIKKSTFFFVPYKESQSNRGYSLEITQISEHINAKDYEVAIKKSEEIIRKLLTGVDYYHTYNRFSLSISVNIAFGLWLVLIILEVFRGNTDMLRAHRYSKFTLPNIFKLMYFLGVFLFCSFLYVKSKDLSYVMYSALPFLMTGILLNKVDIIWNLISCIQLNFKKTSCYEAIFLILLVAVGIKVLVMAFFNRAVLSVVGLVLSLLPWLKVLTEHNSSLKTTKTLVCILYTITSLMLSVFPQLPVIQSEHNYLLVIVAGFLIATIGVIYTMLVKDTNTTAIFVQTGLLILSLVVKMHSVRSIENGDGLPRVNQIYSWSALILLPGIIFITDKKSPSRLLSVILSFSAVYALMSISYELLFFAVLSVHLFSWMLLEVFVVTSPDHLNKNQREVKGKSEGESILTKDHVRVAFMFVYCIFTSFFGTGNIASINSFDLASTYCFQTVFNPWTQGVILATKVLLPFLMVTILFRSMHTTTSIPMNRLFLVILIITDVMSIHFFFLVKDEGSWLDIGQSLSHFIITLTFVIFLVPFYQLSFYISGFVSLKVDKQHVM